MYGGVIYTLCGNVYQYVLLYSLFMESFRGDNYYRPNRKIS